jgi:hypothetical protein
MTGASPRRWGKARVVWGDAAEHLMDAIRATCVAEFGRTIEWRLGPGDRIYRLVIA